MSELRYSKKFDLYYYKKEKDLFFSVKKRVKNNTFNMDVKYLTDMKTFIELIRTLENYNEWLETKKQFILSECEDVLMFVKNYNRNTNRTTNKNNSGRKYGNSQFYSKELKLFHHTKKRVGQGSLPLEDKYLTNIKVFVNMVRTLDNYDEWLNSDKKYELTFDDYNKELMFNVRGCKPCAKINRYTKKVTYFNSVGELSEDVGYCKPTINKTMNTLTHRDGFYYCHVDKVEEILQQL